MGLPELDGSGRIAGGENHEAASHKNARDERHERRVVLDDQDSSAEGLAGWCFRDPNDRSFVVKKGSKILDWTSGGIPMPESLTAIITYEPGTTAKWVLA